VQVNERVAIAPILHGRISTVDLIGPEAHSFQVIHYDNLQFGSFFSVSTDTYFLESRITEHGVSLTRNNVQVSAALASPENRTGYFLVEIVWTPTELTVNVADNSGQRQNSIQTPPTFPPHSLQEWARREALLPRIVYENPIAVYDAALDQLQQLKKKIVDTNAINGFWDIQYDGNAIVSRKPKRETDIHPQIRLLLYDFELLKNLQVIPEYPIGSGRLDFLVSGHTVAGRVVNVCIEFKLGHATDLAHGIAKQLPEYMARRTTDFGIFCVLAFGEEYPANTAQFEIPSVDSKNKTLDLILPLAASETGLPYLRALILDLSRRPAPTD
jgi:hypothetical protein